MEFLPPRGTAAGSDHSGCFKSRWFLHTGTDEIDWKRCCVQVGAHRGKWGLSSSEVGGGADVIGAGSRSLLKPHWFWLSNDTIWQSECTTGMSLRVMRRAEQMNRRSPAQRVPSPKIKLNAFECCYCCHNCNRYDVFFQAEFHICSEILDSIRFNHIFLFLTI